MESRDLQILLGSYGHALMQWYEKGGDEVDEKADKVLNRAFASIDDFIQSEIDKAKREVVEEMIKTIELQSKENHDITFIKKRDFNNYTTKDAYLDGVKMWIDKYLNPEEKEDGE